MARPRYYFHLATIRSGGEEKMFAVGGSGDTSSSHNTVEEWVEESSTWKAADNLIEKRQQFAAVAVPRKLICPLLEDSLLYITGGWRLSPLSATEIYPPVSGCPLPPLPSSKCCHSTFVTSEPTSIVATCGGQTEEGYTASCLVLDQINQRWDDSRMGSLTMPRYQSAVATLDYIGVFIVGGDTTNNKRTSEFLAAGTMQWQEGPALPVDMIRPCAVVITATSFLAIYGRDIFANSTLPFRRRPAAKDGERLEDGQNSRQAGLNIQDVPKLAKRSS